MLYEIKVQGNVDPSWSDWFNGMDITNGTDKDASLVTTLTGPVVDQATLRGILIRLWDLNLVILSVIQVEWVEKSNDRLTIKREV